MNRIRYRLWSIGVLVVLALAFLIYWGHENWTHATPEKLQAIQYPSSQPLQTIHFQQGVVLFARTSAHLVSATYMKRNFWGWHEVDTSEIATPSPQQTKAEFGTDVASMAINNQTIVWSTFMKPIKIMEHHNGKVFIAKVEPNRQVWYIVLPFKQNLFPYSEWTMVLPNGKTGALFMKS